MSGITEKLTAPERWALTAARSTATSAVPTALCLVLTGLLIAQGMSLSMFVLLVWNATMVWERLGFTRLLRRKDRPQVVEHTVS